MPDNQPVITPEMPVHQSLKRYVSSVVTIVGVAGAVVWGYARLEGRVSASEHEVGLRASTVQVDHLAERVNQAATKADLERLGSEMREAFMGARWLCVRTREGMECMTRVRHR